MKPFFLILVFVIGTAAFADGDRAKGHCYEGKGCTGKVDSSCWENSTGPDNYNCCIINDDQDIKCDFNFNVEMLSNEFVCFERGGGSWKGTGSDKCVDITLGQR